ncbi:MAG: nuclear transport factor 2 family protein [Betaproteobacteria bacterium]
MHPNEQCIRRFYAAFANRDASAMGECYHRDISFSDPVFPMLKGAEASGMWRMLVTRSKDLDLALLEALADDTGGRAIWEARYTFSQTGRPVVNRIQATFAFRDGLIIRHVDRFPFWNWSKQALGPIGLLLGWSWPLKAMVRKNAAASLDQFMAKYPQH